MAMSNAERQRAYREKRKNSGDGRINTVVSAGAQASLKRIARYEGITEKEALERILEEAEQLLLDNNEKLKNPRTKIYKNYFAPV